MKISPIRKSQLIFNSGPGAIVETSDWSGVVSTLAEWTPEKLQRIPKKSRRGLGILLRPPVIVSKIGFSEAYTPFGKVPVRRFPLWVQCSNPSCSIFGPFWLIKSQKDEFKCVSCFSKLVPARLIRICPKGHIDDIPWEQFYHGEDECGEAHPKMKLVASDNQTGALSDLKLFCRCKKHRDGLSLGNIYSFPLAKGCTGKKPWLDQPNDKCTETSLIVLRGASNVYFPEIKSEITIPESNETFQRFLEEELEVYHDLLRDADKVFIESFLGRPHIYKLLLQRSIDPGEFGNYILQRFSSQITTERSEEDIRGEELKVLSEPQIVRENVLPKVFSAKGIDLNSSLKSLHVNNLVRVDRLQEIRVLQGFNRVFPNTSNLVDIGSESNGHYPAIEVSGEGIFLSLDEQELQRWEKNPQVQLHCSKLLNPITKFRRLPFSLAPRSILLHSLAHALIKQMSLYGGYSSVSIREKIYSFPDRNGLLLYTGESDSEGTMGGIVSMADPLKFHGIFEEALAESRWCSSDPICSENAHEKTTSQNLAACHACLFLSETSCEASNKYLDRNVLIDDEIGFWRKR